MSRRLAGRFDFRRDRGHVYHLCNSSIYDAIGQNDNRNRRRTSAALIARKLMLLDYVLAHRDVDWYATEADKVALFTGPFAVPALDLPQRIYVPRLRQTPPTFRITHRGQPVTVESSPEFSAVASLGGEAPALLVQASGDDAPGACYFVSINKDAVQVAPIGTCEGSLQARPLTSDHSAFTRARDRNAPAGRIDRVSFATPGLYLFDGRVVDTGTRTSRTFSTDGQSNLIARIPPLGISPDEASFIRLESADSNEQYVLAVTMPYKTSSGATRDDSQAVIEALGAKVDVMDAAHHDVVLAVTSHLPHLIAYTIVGTASELEEVTESEVIKYSAGGLRDFTRIAASDPVMWRDVFLANKDAVLATLQRFNEDLTVLQQAIRRGDADKLEDWFTRTRAIRRSIIAEGQDDAAPDFGRKH